MIQLPKHPEQDQKLPIDTVTSDFAKEFNNEKTRIERERIERYLMTEASAPMVSQRIEKNGDEFRLLNEYRENDLTDNQKGLIDKVSLFAATGTTNKAYAQILIEQTQKAFFYNGAKGTRKLTYEDFAEKLINTENAINGAMTALNPKDEIEGMLCSRLVMLHNQYMQYMGNATQTTYSEFADIETPDFFINRAIKLMRIYNETLDALNKYRRKGEQKVTVQHVHINDGAQAIVAGKVESGRGDAKKT